MRPWEDVLTETDRQVAKRYGKKRGLGKTPALLMIDCQYNHIGGDKPILEQLDEYPSGGGAEAWQAVRRLAPVRDAARAAGAMIIYTRYCYTRQGARYDAFALKRGAASFERYLDTSPTARIVEELTPTEDELVIDKVHASAFFGTPLLPYLTRRGIDSIVVAGVSTSGCVRASAVDATSLGFNVAVLEDCTADRITISHKAALLDLWMKYCDVITSQEAIEYLKGVTASKG